MRDALHFVGTTLALLGAVVSLLSEAQSVGAATAILLGALIASLTHQAGVHGPREGE